MSAGAFADSKYQASAENGSGIHYIRVQPETLALTVDSVSNTAPTGAVSSQLSATVSGSTRRRGLHAAKIRFRFTTELPDGYLAGSILALPALNKEILAKVKKGIAGTYLGKAIICVGKSAEVLRQ